MRTLSCLVGPSMAGLFFLEGSLAAVVEQPEPEQEQRGASQEFEEEGIAGPEAESERIEDTAAVRGASQEDLEEAPFFRWSDDDADDVAPSGGLAEFIFFRGSSSSGEDDVAPPIAGVESRVGVDMRHEEGRRSPISEATRPSMEWRDAMLEPRALSSFSVRSYSSSEEEKEGCGGDQLSLKRPVAVHAPPEGYYHVASRSFPANFRNKDRQSENPTPTTAASSRGPTPLPRQLTGEDTGGGSRGRGGASNRWGHCFGFESTDEDNNTPSPRSPQHVVRFADDAADDVTRVGRVWAQMVETARLSMPAEERAAMPLYHPVSENRPLPEEEAAAVAATAYEADDEDLTEQAHRFHRRVKKLRRRLPQMPCASSDSCASESESCASASSDKDDKDHRGKRRSSPSIRARAGGYLFPATMEPRPLLTPEQQEEQNRREEELWADFDPYGAERSE